MKQDEKDTNKKTAPAAKSQQPVSEAEHEAIAHASQGHTTKEPGHQDPSLRTSTTDSSRSHKNPHDDLPDGGNVR